jgi:Fe2+ transport system protein FeoA
MSIFDLKVGERSKITNVDVGGAAYKRLQSLGFNRGADVQVLSFSLFKSSVLLSIGATRVALRRAVAEKILVATPRGVGSC